MQVVNDKATFSELVHGPEPVLGCFALLDSPAVVELIAISGFSFVVIDREHSPKDWSTVGNMIRAAEARGIPALVRVSSCDRIEILGALESGADGVVVPGITGLEQALEAVSAMRFPPVGERGACPQSRAANYGVVDYKQFQPAANAERTLVLLLESIEALEQIEEIAAAVGDSVAYMVGRSDLAASMGLPGQTNAPEVRQATEDFLVRLRRFRPEAVIGMGFYEASEIGSWLAKGCRFFWSGADISLFVGSGQHLNDQFNHARKQAAAVTGVEVSA